jgi:hypothetical protein
MIMTDNKHYYTKLHPTGFKYANKFSGFDSACAHFSTEYESNTRGWLEAQIEAIEFIGAQEVTHGWVDYTVGKTFEQDGSEPVSVMSPAWEYHKGSSFPTYKEVN